jgi:LuxR family maltose regulon positive regulatory protein
MPKVATTGLTDRERQCLCLAEDGLHNPEIATQLGIGTGSVRGYLENVYDKLGERNRIRAAKVAREQGLLQ